MNAEPNQETPFLSDEQFEQITKRIEDLVEKLQPIIDALRELIKEFLERVRMIAEKLTRFFVKMQLLEWRVPAPIAESVSQKMYWRWAFRLGFSWLKRKMALIE